jgi:hypothetical protein
VVVLGPTEPFSNEELGSLKRYLDARHGKLFLALDADAISTRDTVTLPEATASAKSPAPPASAKSPEHPAPATSGSAKAPSEPPPAPPSGPLGDLAALVGLTYGTDPLANDRSHVRMRNDDSDRTRLVSQSFSSHASVSTLSKNTARAAVAFFGSGNLEKARGATQNVDFAVRSPSGTFADKNRNYQFERDSEKQTTYNLAAAVTEASKSKDAAPKDGKKDEKGKDKASNPEEMRAFVLADSDAVGDFVLSQDPWNQLLFIDSMRWLVGEESFAGPPNTEEDQRIQHTKQQDLSWFYATIFGAPGLVLAAGLFVSRRSRAKGGRR